MDTSRGADVLILGGCGHVGLPLGLAFADAGLQVTLCDLNQDAVDRVNAGRMPHAEPGAPEVLQRTLANGKLHATTLASEIESADHVVIVIDPPFD